MKPFNIALLFTLLTAVSAQHGYRYQQPQAAVASHQHHHHQQHQHQQHQQQHHQHQQAVPLQQPSPIFSSVQSLPLQSFHAPQAAPQVHVASQPLPAPEVPLAPPPLPVLPPAFMQQHSHFGGAQQQQQHQQQHSSFHSQQAQFGGAQFGGPSSGGHVGGLGNGLGGGFSGFQQNVQSAPNVQSFQSRPQTAIITKDIYIHSAPEEPEETLLGGNQLDNGPIRKNYRIVFIKAPSHNIKLAPGALQLAQNANEDKTVIYVLSKKPDLSAVQQQLQQVQTQQKSHKPEVYFIKYKTQEEAQRAQQEIQAQYDALGGSTHISDEGIAPVQTIAGLGGAGGGALNLGSGGGDVGHVHQHNSLSGGFQPSLPSNQYLPLKRK